MKYISSKYKAGIDTYKQVSHFISKVIHRDASFKKIFVSLQLHFLLRPYISCSEMHLFWFVEKWTKSQLLKLKRATIKPRAFITGLTVCKENHFEILGCSGDDAGGRGVFLFKGFFCCIVFDKFWLEEGRHHVWVINDYKESSIILTDKSAFIHQNFLLFLL